VVILHHMLSKAVVKARPSVLWCYKRELGFSRSAHYTWPACCCACVWDCRLPMLLQHTAHCRR